MLALEPDPSVGLGVGDIVDVELWARSESTLEDVNSLQALITFDHTVLRVIDASGDPASTIIPGPSLDFAILNAVGPDATGSEAAEALLDGEIYYSAAAISSVAQTDFLVATARFEVREQFGSTTIRLPPDILMHDPFQYQSKVIVAIGEGSGVAALELQDGTLYGAEPTNPEPVIPEPTTLFVFCVGTCVLGLRRRRSRRRHMGG